MSAVTKFSANRQEVTETEQFERVNWQYFADLSVLGLSISDKSGIVKVDLGLGRRNPALYRNEILAMLDKADEIRRYLEDHPQAKSTPPSAKERRRLETLEATVNAVKNQQIAAMIKSMRDTGLSEEVIQAAVSNLK